MPVAVEEKLTNSSCGFYSDMVVHRALKALFASKVLLRSLYRDVAEQELNLFQFASGDMTQSGTRAAKIVRSELGIAQLCGMFLDNVPDRLLRQAVTPSLARFTDASKYSSGIDPSRTGPLISDLLYPIGNGNGPNVSTFPDQIYDGPMFVAPL